MKRSLILLCLLAIYNFACSQVDVSKEKWQEDLKYLQEKIHNDYPFLFLKITKEQFDAEVEKFYKEIPRMEKHQIVIGFAKIVSLFKYGHTSVRLSNSPVQIRYIPVNLYQFTDGVYIQGVRKDYEESLGAKVLEVEGVPIEKVLEAIRPTVPIENDQFFISYGIVNATSPEILHAQGITKSLKAEVTLTLSKDNNTFTKTFKAGDRPNTTFGLIVKNDEWLDAREGEDPLYLKHFNKNYYFEYLPENKILYVRQSQQIDESDESIAEFYKKVYDFINSNQVDKFVIDVRLNSGGNNYKNKPIVIGAIQSKNVNQRGKFFVITGRRTFSACQNLVNELDTYTNALFIGEPTAENLNFYGDNREEVLPNSKMPVYLSFAWWQDKPVWENDDWLTPDLFVQMSFDDYINGRDPVMDEVINFSENSFVLNPTEYLKNLFESDKMKFAELASQMKDDQRYRFINVESQINEMGYALLAEKEVQSALSIFKLNTELYSNSANAWDSLGEAYWAADEIDEAIKSYNKAIELDPEGSVGENSKRMLNRIKAESKNLPH